MSTEIQDLPASERLKYYKTHLGVIAFSSEVKKRSTQQEQRYLESCEVIRENFEDFFKLITDDTQTRIMFDFAAVESDPRVPASMSWLSEGLNDPDLKPPTIEQNMLPSQVETIAVKLYSARTTVAAYLEDIEPVYARWLLYERRLTLLWKAICQFGTEWKADSFYQVLVPKEIYNRIRELGEYVEAYKIRLSSLDKAWDIVSRLVTIYVSTPIEPMSGYSREARDAQPKQTSSNASPAFQAKRGFGRRSTPKST